MAETLLRTLTTSALRLGAILAFCAVYAQAQAPAASNARAVPLAEVVFPELAPLLQKAMEQSPRSIGSNLEVLIARENIRVARARSLPQAGGNLTYSYARDQRIDRSEPLMADKLAYNFSLTQPIYHWGALKAGTKLSEIAARATENNVAEVRRLLLLEIRAAYLRLVVLKASAAKAAYAHRLALEEEKQVKAQIEAGETPPASILNAETKVKQARLDLDRAEEDCRYARESIERLAGIDSLPDESVPSLIPHIDYPVELVRSMAELHRSDPEQGNFRLAAVQLRLEQEKLNYQIIDKTLRPKVNFVTGAYQDELSYTGSPADRARTQSLYGGINITWNVFDGYSTPAQRRASRLRQRQLEEERDDRRREISQSVQSLVRQVDFSARSTALSEVTLDQYNLFVRKKAEDIEFGSSAPSEIDGITIARDGVLIQAMIQRADLMGRLAELLSAIGRDPALVLTMPPPP